MQTPTSFLQKLVKLPQSKQFIHNRFLASWRQFALSVLLSISLVACQNNVEEVTSKLPPAGVKVVFGPNLIAINNKVASASDPSTTNESIQVVLTVNGLEHAMTVDTKQAWIDWDTLQLESGDHLFNVSIYYPIKTLSATQGVNTVTPILIAQGSQNSKYSAVNFSENMLNVLPFDIDGNGKIDQQETLLFDADEDGMANLAEILMGGNPNNPGPTFLSETSVSVPERQKVSIKPNYIVYTAKAVSPRANSMLNYSVSSTSGPTDAPFAINPLSGDVYLDARAAENWPSYIADTVEANIYTITLLVNDGTISSQLVLTLNITDAFNLRATAEVKALHFNWQEVLDKHNNNQPADYYKLFENPDGRSGFVEVTGGDRIKAVSPSTEVQYTHKIAVHKLNYQNAQYQVAAYRSADPTDTSTNGDIIISKSETFFVADLLIKTIGYVKAPNPATNDQLGNSIRISGDGRTLAVSTAGNEFVYLFTRAANIDGSLEQWMFRGTVTGPIGEPNGGFGAGFGDSISLSEDGGILAVGDYAAFGKTDLSLGGNCLVQTNCLPNSGAVYVFERPSAGWPAETNSPTAYITAPNIGFQDQFGWSVSLSADGNVLAVGAKWEDNAADGAMGTIVNDICTGGGGETGCATDSGAVYVFEIPISGWRAWNNTIHRSKVTYLKAPNAGREDRFGYSINLSGDGAVLAVGAREEDNGPDGSMNAADTCSGDPVEIGCARSSGAVYIFERPSTTNSWAGLVSNDVNVSYIKISNAKWNDWFGHSVNLNFDGSTLAVGAPLKKNPKGGSEVNCSTNNIGCIENGAAFVFNRPDTGSWMGWTNTKNRYASLIFPDLGADNYFGWIVTISHDGELLVVGAPNKNYSTNLSTVPFNECSDPSGPDCALAAGAVFVYQRPKSGEWFDWHIDNNIVNYLTAPNLESKDGFGTSASLSGDGKILAVGAVGEDSGVQYSLGNPIQSIATESLSGIDLPVINNNMDGAGAVYLY